MRALYSHDCEPWKVGEEEKARSDCEGSDVRGRLSSLCEPGIALDPLEFPCSRPFHRTLVVACTPRDVSAKKAGFSCTKLRHLCYELRPCHGLVGDVNCPARPCLARVLRHSVVICSVSCRAGMVFDLVAPLGMAASASDHTSVVSINLFVALLCGCIVIGHLLEENRWMNESITALIIVGLSNPFLEVKFVRVRRELCSNRCFCYCRDCARGLSSC
ncbi:hypothetical protein GW17_00003421 [Ensete ventricosum]|nr:hypothetical protein GW17_00003421 [Ensete ventricosum]